MRLSDIGACVFGAVLGMGVRLGAVMAGDNVGVPPSPECSLGVVVEDAGAGAPYLGSRFAGQVITWEPWVWSQLAEWFAGKRACVEFCPPFDEAQSFFEMFGVWPWCCDSAQR